MRPVFGSATTTLPAYPPKALTAARRMVRSSPSMLSPRVGSTGGGNLRLTAADFFLVVLLLVAAVVFLCGVVAATPRSCSTVRTTAGTKKNLFMRGACLDAVRSAHRLLHRCSFYI